MSSAERAWPRAAASIGFGSVKHEQYFIGYSITFSTIDKISLVTMRFMNLYNKQNIGTLAYNCLLTFIRYAFMQFSYNLLNLINLRIAAILIKGLLS